MKIVTIPDDISREELFEKVQNELDAILPHSRALVFLDKQILNHSVNFSAGTHTIRCLPILKEMRMYLCGARADVVAVKSIAPITRDLVNEILVILYDHPKDNGVLICQKELEEMLK